MGSCGWDSVDGILRVRSGGWDPADGILRMVSCGWDPARVAHKDGTPEFGVNPPPVDPKSGDIKGGGYPDSGKS